MSINEEGYHNSARKPLELQFRSKIPNKIFTGDEIKGEGGNFMEVALVDTSTGNIVLVGQEASLRVEIFLLHGDFEGDYWTCEEFEANIVWDIKGKKSYFTGTAYIKLHRGIASMKNIKFKHRVSELKPPVFCLGARILNRVHRDKIKEAKTENFTIQNYRRKYFEKYDIPSLTDQVYRLKNIAKGGKIEKRLHENEIKTVADFLIRFLRDPDGLKDIVRMVPKKWIDTLTNAQACKDKDARMFCYVHFQQKAVIVFNILGNILRWHTTTMTMPDTSRNHEVEARELLASACIHWDDVNHFDDWNALHEHFISLTKDWEATDSQRPTPAFQSWSNSNLHGDICVEDYDTNYRLEIIDDFIRFRTPSVSHENRLCGQLFYAESTDDRNIAEYVELQHDDDDVRDRHSPNVWNVFWCIWRWRSIGRKRKSTKELMA